MRRLKLIPEFEYDNLIKLKSENEKVKNVEIPPELKAQLAQNEIRRRRQKLADVIRLNAVHAKKRKTTAVGVNTMNTNERYDNVMKKTLPYIRLELDQVGFRIKELLDLVIDSNIYWNEALEVIIDKNKIEESNILTILKHIFNEDPTVIEPIGYKEVLNVLKRVALYKLIPYSLRTMIDPTLDNSGLNEIFEGDGTLDSFRPRVYSTPENISSHEYEKSPAEIAWMKRLKRKSLEPRFNPKRVAKDNIPHINDIEGSTPLNSRWEPINKRKL